MQPNRQKAFTLAIIDVWLPLLLSGQITQQEFKAFVSASFETETQTMGAL